MKTYDSYKDSGIEWIGEIPNHWEIKKFGHLFSFSRGLGITKQDLKDEGIPCVNYGEIHSKFGFSVNPEIHKLKCVEESFFEKGKKSLLRRGDFIFADTSEDIEGSGNFTVLDSDLPTFAGYHTVIARQNNENHYKYLAYCFDSLEFRSQIRSAVSGIKVFSITQAILKSSKVLLPTYPEQTAIAHYLDHKTTEIDELITDKKRLLELYEEEKTAIINELVTGKKVWNGHAWTEPAEVKDSGIEWLGEIPEQWEVKRLKYVAEITLGKMLTKENKGEMQLKPYLRAANLGWLNVDVSDVKEMWFTQNDLKKLRLEQNDLLVSEGGEVGRTCIWKNELDECYIQNSVHKVTMNEACEPNYFLNQFYLFGKKGAFDLIVNRISIAHLTVEKLREVEFIVPPLKEQQSIVHHIETECSRIDTQVERTKKLIDLLKEYREALISEVVTGKIRVV